MDQNATNQYQTQQLMSANPATLIFMLYDEAIRSLQKAMEAIAEGDIEGRWRANNKAMEIIGELTINLDMENGGQIADRLYQLYRFLTTSLPQVDIRNDPKPAEEAIKLLEPIRDSWRELSKKDTAELAQARAEAKAEMTRGQAEEATPAALPKAPQPAAPAAEKQSGVKISA